MKTRGDRAGEVRQGKSIDLRDRQHAAAGGRQKHFIGVSQLVDRDRTESDRDAQPLAQLDRGAPGNPLQHAAISGQHAAVLDHEDVEARAFGHVAVGIGDAARVAAPVVGVEERLHEVEPMVVLDRRVD